MCVWGKGAKEEHTRHAQLTCKDCLEGGEGLSVHAGMHSMAGMAGMPAHLPGPNCHQKCSPVSFLPSSFIKATTNEKGSHMLFFSRK